MTRSTAGVTVLAAGACLLMAGCQRDAALDAKLTTIQEDNATLKSEKLADRAKLESEIQALTSRLRQAEDRQRGVERDSADFSGRVIAAVQDEGKDLSRKITGSSEDILKEMRALKERLAQAEQQPRRAGDETMQPLLDALRQDYAEAQQKLFAAEIKSAEWQSQLENMRASIAKLLGDLGMPAGSTLADVPPSVEALRAKLAEAERKQRESADAITTLNEQALELKARLDGALDRNKQLTAQVQDLVKKNAQFDSANQAFAAGAGGTSKTQAPVEGTVSYVDGQSDLVAMRVDRIEEVRRDETVFFVYRRIGDQERYIATVKAFEVHSTGPMKHTVIGPIVDIQSEAKIQGGDRVTTERRH